MGSIAVAHMMAEEDNQFYPTPEPLIEKMLAGIDFALIETVLEPSAGKGDIAKAVAHKYRSQYWRTRRLDDNCADKIDTIEIEPNLRFILKGLNYRVVHNDFLTYHSRKQYSLIVMNPPFAEGDKHLLKALELQKRGGMIRCLLNAETLRNPYTNTRKALVRRLAELEAEIEYLSGAFIAAERETHVEVALVKIDIPHDTKSSVILDDLRKAQTAEEFDYEPTAIAHGDFIKAIVERYRFEVDAGVRLIREYTALLPYMEDSVKSEYKNPILELKLHSSGYKDQTVLNGYICAVRKKYWETLFESPEFVSKLPSNIQSDLYERVNELAHYEFSVSNILEIQLQMSKQTVRAIEDTILALFDQLSGKHAYHETLDNGNIHYFDGWKTNKAWKINKKVIVPFYGAIEIWCGKLSFGYEFRGKMHDIMTVLDFLSADFKGAGDASRILEEAAAMGQTRNIRLGYISITVFKKGTCHITFEDEHLLDRFNLFGAQRRGWLPPSYGKKKYRDMDSEERAVVDSYEGEASYARVMANPKAYIVETAGFLALGEGEGGSDI